MESKGQPVGEYPCCGRQGGEKWVGGQVPEYIWLVGPKASAIEAIVCELPEVPCPATNLPNKKGRQKRTMPMRKR